MRRFYLLLLISLLTCPCLFAQETVRIGTHSFVPEQNISTRAVRSARLLPAGDLCGNANYRLIQFSQGHAPDHAKLRRQGIQLLDYVGGNAYFARVEQGNVNPRVRGTGAVSLMPIHAEWKMPDCLRTHDVPDYVRKGDDYRLVVTYFPNVDKAALASRLTAMGAKIEESFDFVRRFEITISKQRVTDIANLPAVQRMGLPEIPQTLLDIAGRGMANVLPLVRESALANGRQLTGKGVNVAVIDGNVERHPDLSARLTQKDFSYSVQESSAHGMHVAGIIGGAGLLDPNAIGMAPETELYAYNFARAGSVPPKMLEAHKKYGVTITSNSYGEDLRRLCSVVHLLSYNFNGKDIPEDKLQFMYPTLLNVFACGNSQGACDGMSYYTTTNRSKNSLLVGAINGAYRLTDFSSMGPVDDGRLIPHVVFFGSAVYSLDYNNAYQIMSGTSQACPGVSGILALISQRYKQLNGGSNPENSLLKGVLMNTATDIDNKGVDYKTGFGLPNGTKAVKALEQQQYKLDHFEIPTDPTKTEEKTFVVTLDKAYADARFMLVWADTVMDREYSYGDSPLVNDLDIVVVDPSGAEIKPWVLDKDAPSALPQRKEDHLNNVEQVTIANAQAGKYTVKIKWFNASEKNPGSKQRFALTWWHENPDPKILSPGEGQVFSPGQVVPLLTQDLPKDGLFAIEMSTDGGKTYQNILKSGRKINNIGGLIRIPYDAEFSHMDAGALTTARLRMISDKTHQVLFSDDFYILPQPQNVTVQNDGTSSAGIIISWDPVENLTEGTWQVLQMNKDFTAFEVVEDDVPVSKHFALLPPTTSLNGVLNFYTVRYKAADNAHYGERAAAAKQTTAQGLTISQLPFVEELFSYPLPYLNFTKGDQLRGGYNTNDGPVAPGRHFIGFTTKDDLDKWPDESDPFKTTNYKATIEMPKVKLAVSDKKIFLKLDLWLRQSFWYGDEPRSIARVMLNGKQLTTLDGRMELVPQNRMWAQTPVYDLSEYAGQTITLKVEWVGLDHTTLFSLDKIQIYAPKPGNDLSLYRMTTLAAKPNRGKEPIKFYIRNEGDELAKTGFIEYTQTSLGETSKAKTVAFANLYPGEQRVITGEADFTSDRSLGQEFALYAQVSSPGDRDVKNNFVRDTTANLGTRIYVPPVSSNKLGIPVDSFQYVTVQDSLWYADAGGMFFNEPYLPQENSTKFLPSDPNKKIVLTFQELDLGTGKREIWIWENQVDDLANINSEYRNVTRILKRKDNFEKGRDTIRFISNAADGSITVNYGSRGGVPGKGWLAIITEETLGNDIKLLAPAKPKMRLKLASPTESYFPEVTITNLSGQPLKNVPISIKILNGNNKDLTIEEIIPEIPNDPDRLEPFKFTFTKAVPLEIGKEVSLYVSAHPKDPNSRDNSFVMDIFADYYCLQPPPVGSDIAEVSLTADTVVLSRFDMRTSSWENTYMALDKPLLRYGKDPFELNITVNEPEYSSLDTIIPAGALGVWIDWNQNGSFDPEERFLCAESPGVKVEIEHSTYYRHQIPIQVTPPNDVEFDEPYRMRIVLMYSADSLTPCPDESDEDLYDIRDLMLELKDEVDPAEGDLVLLGVHGAKLGHFDLKTDSVYLTVKNIGSSDISTATYSIYKNDVKVVTSTPIGTIAPGEEKAIRYPNTIDISAPGFYRIKVTLEGDTNPENNTKSYRRLNNVPEKDGFNALSFHPNGLNAKEYGLLSLSSKNNPIVFNETYTMEMWVNLGREDINNVFYGQDLLLTTLDGSLNDDPRNALAIIITGSRVIWRTPADVIMPGEWTHIALVMQILDRNWGKYATVNLLPILYINGERIPLSQGAVWTTYNPARTSEMVLGGSLVGMMDMLRFWNGLRTADQVKENMFKSVAEDRVDTAGQVYKALPHDCIGEFNFNAGVGNIEFYSVDRAQHGSVISDRTGEFPEYGSIWQNNSQLLEIGWPANATAQAEDSEVMAVYDKSTKKGTITLIAKPGADLTQLKFHFNKIWKNAVITYNNQPITGDQTFDLSSKSIVFKATAELFGTNLEQTYTVNIVDDKSSETGLTSYAIAAAKNTPNNMTADVSSPTDIAESIQIPRAQLGTTFQGRLVLTLTPVDKAKIMVDKSIEHTGMDYTITNIDEPFVVTVRSENGRYTKQYTFTFPQTPTLTWTVTNKNVTFGDANEDLSFTTDPADMDRSVIFVESSDPSVASVANNQLIYTGVGSASLMLKSESTTMYTGALATNQLDVTVAPKSVTATPRPISILQGEPLPTSFLFEVPDLVSQADTLLLSGHECEIRIAGSPVDPNKGTLPAGTYEIVPNPLTTSTLGNYDFTMANGTLTVVENPEMGKVSFTVSNATGAPIEDASIAINDNFYTTKSDGTLLLALPEGTYSYSVSKSASMTTKDGSITLAKAAKEDVQVTLEDAAYTVTYNVEPIEATNESGTPIQIIPGVIVGEAVQNVAADGKTTSVTAAPMTGYMFKQWDDGKTDATRMDDMITENAEHMAQFEVAKYVIQGEESAGATYYLGYDWSTWNDILEPKFKTTVEYGSSYTVKLRTKPGYFFRSWEDGNTDQHRTLRDIHEDITVKPVIREDVSLPYLEDFNGSNEIPEDWVTNGLSVSEGKFKIGDAQNPGLNDYPNSRILSEQGMGNVAFINFATSTLNLEEASLYTPVFHLEQDKIYELSFDYLFNYSRAEALHTIRVEYQTQSSDQSWDFWTKWIKIEGKNKQYVLEELKRQFSIIELGASPRTRSMTVRFRIHFERNGAFFAAASFKDLFWMDNFKLQDLSRRIMFTTSTGGSINVTMADGSLVHEYDQMMLLNQKLPEVEAVPDPGYVFVKWSDDRTDNPRIPTPVESSLDITPRFMHSDSVEYPVIISVIKMGKGVEGATIDLSHDNTPVLLTNSSTSADGTLRLELRPGNYRAVVTTATDQKSVDFTITKSTNLVRMNLDPDAPATTQVIFSVIADGKPAAGATLSLQKDGSSASLSAITTDAEGSATAKLEPGDYTLIAKSSTGEVTVNFTVAQEIKFVRAILQSETPTPIADLADTKVAVNPNPFNDHLMIESAENVAIWRLLDLSGRTVRSGRNGGDARIDISTMTLEPGLYIMQLETQNGLRKQLRLIKQ